MSPSAAAASSTVAAMHRRGGAQLPTGPYSPPSLKCNRCANSPPRLELSFKVLRRLFERFSFRAPSNSVLLSGGGPLDGEMRKHRKMTARKHTHPQAICANKVRPPIHRSFVIVSHILTCYIHL